jgi:hypothetical protein
MVGRKTGMITERQRLILIGLACLGFLVSGILAQETPTDLPPEETSEATAEVTAVVTPSPTATPTAIPSPTPTVTPSWTPVIIVVTQPPQPTLPPVIITQPPQPTLAPIVITQPPVIITQPVVIPVLPTPVPATSNNPLTNNSPASSNRFGWQRYESIEFIQVVGRWQLRTTSNASDGAYHEAETEEAIFRFPFDGEGLRLGFRVQPYGGSFHLRVDNRTLDVFDSMLTEDNTQIRSVVTREYFFDSGYHVLDIYVSVLPEYGGVAIDFVEVFNGPSLPRSTMDAPGGMREAIEIALVSAPPTRTLTPIPPVPSLITVDVVVAYDLNANGEIDPNEGAREVSIRAVDTLTNALLASTVTDFSGFVRMQVSTTNDLQLVIPLLGETFAVRNRGQDIVTSWTLLIPPANVPGLIP